MKIPKIDIPEGTGAKLVKAGLLIVGFFVMKRALSKAAEDSADSQIDTNPAAGQARALNAAMNPSGIDWMRSFDTTDTTAIYTIAPQITDLDAVKDFYKAQTHGRALHQDLTDELGAQGYDKFLALATKGKAGSPKYATTRNDIPANQWVVTSSEANVRKTPRKESKYLPGNNILKVVSKGKVLGVSTGKYAYDESNDTTFLEFWTLGTKTAGKNYFYVAKSQVELLTAEQKAKREKTAKIPVEVLSGITTEADQSSTQVVTIHPTHIYDEQFTPLALVPGNVIIGYPLLTLNTGKGHYTKVQTVQGFIRWVKTDATRMQYR